MRASLTVGSPTVTTSRVMAMAKTPSLRLAKRLNSSSMLVRLYRRGPRVRAARRTATATSSQGGSGRRRLAVGPGRGLVPAGVAHGAGLEEQAPFGTGEGHLLVGVDAASFDHLARGERAGRVVPAVGANGHA